MTTDQDIIKQKSPPIEVSLVSYTGKGSPDPAMAAVDILIYTKSTRLEQGAGLMEKIMNMSYEEKMAELDYMAMSLPSSWEFITYAFQIRNVTRAFTHQLVRTRTGSYAQQAMRIAKMEGFTYSIPPRLLAEDKKNELASYMACMQKIQNHYDALVAAGCEREDARGLLPTNIHTNIIAGFNMRSLSDLIIKRQGMRIQDEYREVLDGMIREVLAVHPWAAKFIMPPELKNIKEVENFVEEMLAAGAIDKKRSLDIHKNLDKLRKGDT